MSQEGRRHPAGQLHLAGRERRLAVPARRVARVTRRGDAVEVVGDGALAVQVAAGLAIRGVAPDDFRTHHPDLEDVFLALTGRDLRA
jgi:hypothetical protein